MRILNNSIPKSSDNFVGCATLLLAVLWGTVSSLLVYPCTPPRGVRVLILIWKWNNGWPGTWNRRAFTLLEVMVAMAILAIAMTTLFGSQSQSLSIATEAKFNTNASLLASLKLAELESGRLEQTDAEGDFGEDFPGYTWKMEVRDASLERPEWFRILGESLRRVDLTVSWGGDPYLYTVRYYIRTGAVQ